jgi:hypothetical protein
MDAMTLFGAALIVGGIALLVYAYIGTRARRRAGRRGRGWSELDRTRPAPRRGLDRLRGVPHIRRSSLLEGVHAGVD